LNGLVPSDFKEAKTLKQLSKDFKAAPDYAERVKIGYVINKRTSELLIKAGKSNRFKNVKICGYREKFSEKDVEQFAAMTYILDDKEVIVSYRGTDDSLVGWKEDFNIVWQEPVPAQKDALLYIDEVSKAFDSQIKIVGHSKGGNLAIYAAAKLSSEEKEQINIVYNFDGPGFLRETLQQNDFKSIEKKTKSVYPQFSTIGMLFHHFKNFSVVRSNQKYIMQHDPFSWGLKATALDEKESLDKGSLHFYKTFNSWFEKLTLEKRKEFVNTFFSVLESPAARDLSELVENWGKNSLQIVKAIASLDSGTRKSTLHTALSIFKEAGAQLPELGD
jgi:hypothetical protein